MIPSANAMDNTSMHIINLTQIVTRSACLEAQKEEMRWQRRETAADYYFLLTSSHKLLPVTCGSNLTFKINRTNFD